MTIVDKYKTIRFRLRCLLFPELRKFDSLHEADAVWNRVMNKIRLQHPTYTVAVTVYALLGGMIMLWLSIEATVIFRLGLFVVVIPMIIFGNILSVFLMRKYVRRQIHIIKRE